MKRNTNRVVWYCVLLVMVLSLTTPGQAQEGMDVFDQILEYVEIARVAAGIPGLALGITSRDSVHLQQGFGVLGASDDRPVDEYTLFQIGSTSKAFTSLLLAYLVAEGLLNWDDYVIDHYPEFRLYDPWVTRHMQIRDLCAQRSGLPPYSGDTNAFFGRDREYMIHSLRHIPPQREFRADFTYINTLFLVAGKVIELKTGMTYEAALDHFIFGPLRMSHSDVLLDSIRFGTNAALPHIPDITEQKELTADPLPLNSPFLEWPYVYGPAGGINSNIVDMVKWLQFHLNRGQVAGVEMIAADQLEYLYRPAVIISHTDGEMVAYAQGWTYIQGEQTMILHSGDTATYHTKLALLPNQDLGIVILSNMGGTAVFDALVNDLILLLTGKPLQHTALELAAQLAQSAEDEPSPWVPQPDLDVQSYLGTYYNPVYGLVKVTDPEDGTLTLWVGDDFANPVVLFPRNQSIFQGVLDSVLELGWFHFVVIDNQADILLAEFAEDEGSGAFKRVE